MGIRVCVSMKESVGDGRECESVRESRGWQRERVQDGGEKVGSGRGSGRGRGRGGMGVCV